MGDSWGGAVAAANRAQKLTNAEVLCGTIESVDLPSNSFDLVCAWMVLEHLYDPIESLTSLEKTLRAGGWITLSVPDAGSWGFRTFGAYWCDLDLPRHMYHFTTDTIEAVLEKASLGVVNVFHQRTSWDVLASLAYIAEERLPHRRQTVRRLVNSLRQELPQALLDWPLVHSAKPVA